MKLTSTTFYSLFFSQCITVGSLGAALFFTVLLLSQVARAHSSRVDTSGQACPSGNDNREYTPLADQATVSRLIAAFDSRHCPGQSQVNDAGGLQMRSAIRIADESTPETKGTEGGFDHPANKLTDTHQGLQYNTK